MRRRSSSRTAWSTTRATWRWCGRGSVRRPAVLVSATPSLETVANVEAGRYAHQRLTSRHAGASMPRIDLVDLRETPPERGRFLAPPLIEAVKQTLARGEQAMLFLNRRGYAPLTLCRHCGHRMQCPNCTAWLVEHRTRSAVAVPPLRPHHPDPAGVSLLRREGQPDPGRPGHRAHHRGSRAGVSRRPPPDHGERHDLRPARRRRRRACDREPRGRSDHRHPTRRQGLALSASDVRRRGRCRSGAGGRRAARVGTDGAVAAPGRRPGRAGGGAGTGDAADLHPGPSGDAGAAAGRSGRLHGQ